MSARTYDHRIRDAIVKSGNPNLFPQLKIPRSTIRAWIRRGERQVITLEPPCDHSLRVHLSRVEAQLVILRQVVRLSATVELTFHGNPRNGRVFNPAGGFVCAGNR